MTAMKWEKIEGREVDKDRYLRVFGEAVAALESCGVDYLLMGGLASSLLGRPRYSQDIDFMVRPEEAKRALAAMSERGFDTQQTEPVWLFKAVKEDVLVDLIFRSQGGVYMDDEMLERAIETEVNGRRVRVMPVEDLVVIKALAHREESAYQWHDALGLIARGDLDWSYLLRRARFGARRVLSLLVYAQSDDLIVPDDVIKELYSAAFSTPQES